MNRNIFENLMLNENIPRDLLKAYAKIGEERSAMALNSESDHKELQRNIKNRRFSKYDYGKSKYKELTKEQAKKLIKGDKWELANLRMLYRGDLIEMEPRVDKVPYAVYRNRNTPVIINGVEKRNAGYITNPFVMIDLVDKIYWTDEYAHLISPDELQKRDQKIAGEYEIGKILDKKDLGYQAYKDYDNFMKHPQHMSEVPDTGDHTKSKELKNAFNNYSSAISLLRKLDNEKDNYEPDEYKIEYDRLKKLADEYLKDYQKMQKQNYGLLQSRKIAKQIQDLDPTSATYEKDKFDLETKYNQAEAEASSDYQTYQKPKDLRYDILTQQHSEKLAKCFSTLQDLSKKIYDIKQLLAARTGFDVMDYNSNTSSFNDRHNIIDCYNTLEVIATRIKQLEDQYIDKDLDGAEQLNAGLGEQISELEDKAITNIVDKYIPGYSKMVNDAIAAYNKYNNEYIAATSEYDAAKAKTFPKSVAKKQADVERNRGKLDPALANIVQFIDD